MAGRETATLFYDAECGFCRATAGLVLAWDRDGRLTLVALQDPVATQRLSDLSAEKRMASWHLVEPDGSRHSGGTALAPLFEILPRGAPLAQLARRFPAAAERLYRLVAEHRDRLAALLPSRLRRSAEETIRRRSGEPRPPEAEQLDLGPEPPTSESEAPEPAPGQPTRAPDGEPAPGFPEPPGKDPGAIPKGRDPHQVLNNPVGEPDPTEWPDPYEKREDPRDPADPDGKPFGEEPHPPTGATSTSEPHPSQDPEAGDRWEGPKRDKLDR